MTTSTTRTPLYNLWQKGLPQNRRFCGKRSRSGMSDFSRLCGNERYEVCGDESRGSAAARNGGFFHGRGISPEKRRLYAVFRICYRHFTDPCCGPRRWPGRVGRSQSAGGLRFRQSGLQCSCTVEKHKTWIASPATIPKSGERNRKIHSCMLYLISI